MKTELIDARAKMCYYRKTQRKPGRRKSAVSCYVSSWLVPFYFQMYQKEEEEEEEKKEEEKKSKTLEDKSRKTEHQNTRLLPIIWRWSEKKPKNPSCFDVFRRGKGAGLGGLRWKKNHNTPIKEAHIKVYSGFRVMGGDRKQVVTMLASHQRSFNAHIFSF